MAITIVATPGAADANSFVSEAEAIAYAETRLNLTGWTTVSGGSLTDSEKKALIEATRELNDLEQRYAGYRVDGVQALSWPRMGVINRDAHVTAPLMGWSGFPEYAYDTIPQRLREATLELAFEFLRAGTTDIARLDNNDGVKRKKVDVLETEWDLSARPVGLARFPRVVRKIEPLLDSESTNIVLRS